MSLIFDGSDKRLVQYNQDLIQLGLKKAAAQADLGRVLREVDDASQRLSLIQKDVVDKKEDLSLVKKQITSIQEEGIRYFNDTSADHQKLDEITLGKKTEISELEQNMASIKGKIKKEEGSLSTISQQKEKLGKDILSLRQDLDKITNDKYLEELAVVSLKDLGKELRSKNKDIEEVLYYLQEKEKFLNRKEADLLKYENRVAKMRQESGNIIEMKFQ